MDTSQLERITTVVMSRNRRADLLTTIPRHRGPVILVDNGSTDGSAEAVADAFPDVQVVRLEENRGAAARNFGVRLADTPYVAFADDDSWWAPGSLERVVELMDGDPRLAVVAARILVGNGEHVDPASTEMAASPLPRRAGAPGPAVLGFVACGSAVRRDAFLAVDGFDEVVFFAGEEERVAWDLAADGWHLAYVDDVVAHHHPSTSRSSDARRQRLLTRNALLTAVMRRPWPVVARQCARSLASGWPGLAAVAWALPRMRAALAQRRRVPEALEHHLALLEGHGG